MQERYKNAPSFWIGVGWIGNATLVLLIAGTGPTLSEHAFWAYIGLALIPTVAGIIELIRYHFRFIVRKSV